jgi:hypothetical protein
MRADIGILVGLGLAPRDRDTDLGRKMSTELKPGRW